MKIFLCGLPNVGKTTYGHAIAKKLGWAFVDLDRLLETLYLTTTGKKKSCREIYLDEGADAFRAWEHKALTQPQEKSDTIIALGGGALENEENRRIIRQIGQLIYLRCSSEFAFARIKQQIPAYLDKDRPYDSFIELAACRQKTYSAACDYAIDVEQLDLDAIMARIIHYVERNKDHVKQ